MAFLGGEQIPCSRPARRSPGVFRHASDSAVEDDPDVRVLMEHVLIGDSYSVDPVSTVAAGRALLGRERYDLVLADGVLPDGGGLAVADDAERRGIPAIVVTGYAFSFPKGALPAMSCC